MAFSLRIAGQSTAARYFGWAPVRCELRGTSANAVNVVVSQRGTARRGRLRFGKQAPTAAQLELRLPGGGTPVALSVAGEFGHPSRSDGDVKIVVKDKQGTKLAEFPAMVRVRKSADTLTAGERDRFLKAFAVLNAGGAGVFQSFRDTHTLATAAQAHGNAAFLPWHRAFLLDLERELQRVQPSVALPYWRFDVPARKMFTADFIGAQDLNTETAKFSPNNPLGQWSTDGRPGIDRLADFDTRTGHAAVIGEQTVVTFAGPFARLPRPFESNPHGQAHTSFFGFLRDLEMAARDPLFYLLHCNVDRLWAKWQWINQRMQPSGAANFGFEDNGTAVPEGQRPPGHNLADEMWPWNNVKTAPRPPFAPRHPFPGGVGVSAPAAKPKVRMMIDYQGIHDPAARLGFDYDDVPFQP